MRLFDGLRTGLRSLVSSWLRSLLSVLGVVIGVGTLVVMISIGEGTKRQIVHKIEAMGSNLIVIENSPGKVLTRRETVGLNFRDVELLQEHCYLTKGVVPLKMVPMRAAYGGRSHLFIAQGTTAELPRIAKLDLAGGRFLCPRDVAESAKVCVLGAAVPRRLGIKENLVNKCLTLNGQGFLVVGLLREKGPTRIINPDICVFIPISVSREMAEDRASLSNILVQGWSADLVHRTKEELSRLLSFFHGGNEDFVLWAQDELLEKQKEATETLQKALGAIALIALVIAGIGIMNVLLVSVSERIREIGIRKAVGANPLDVLTQFVWESLLLTVTGGIIGIIVGVAASNWICKILNVHLPQTAHRWEAPISPQSILISFAFALLTGLFFGLYPAVKAARLEPCEALTYE
jgi:putative ABC transport system permease protein